MLCACVNLVHELLHRVVHNLDSVGLPFLCMPFLSSAKASFKLVLRLLRCYCWCALSVVLVVFIIWAKFAPSKLCIHVCGLSLCHNGFVSFLLAKRRYLILSFHFIYYFFSSDLCFIYSMYSLCSNVCIGSAAAFTGDCGIFVSAMIIWANAQKLSFSIMLLLTYTKRSYATISHVRNIQIVWIYYESLDSNDISSLSPDHYCAIFNINNPIKSKINGWWTIEPTEEQTKCVQRNKSLPFCMQFSSRSANAIGA